MKRWQKAAVALGAVAWIRTARRRNARLEPPPVRDGAGRPLPARTVEYSDGERVEVVDVGRGPPVLWVPGADGVKETWRHQLPAFAGRHRCIAPDLRRRFDPRHTFDRFADDLAELLDATGAGPVVVVGQSLGGAISIRFAYRFPERVRGLVLCNTLARVTYDHVGLNRTALVPVAIGATRYLPTPLARAAAALWSRLAVWIYDPAPDGGRLVDYALFSGPRTVDPRVSGRRVDLLRGLDLRPELDSILAPTLVMKGPLDSYCLPEWSLDIAARLRGSRYVTVPGTGHCSHVSAPEAFNRLLGSWLDEVTGSGTAAEAEGRIGETGAGEAGPEEAGAA